MPFDVAAARKDGVPEDVILQHLTQSRKFDVEGALKDGASKAQIIDYLASAPAPAKMSVSEKAKANQDPASPGNVRSDRIIADATQDIKNRAAKTVGEAAAMIPFMVAAPFTAGSSLAMGLGIMGAAGLASGLTREGTKLAIGSNEVPKGADLAISLGIDTAVGAAGQGLAHGIGYAGKTLLPKLIERSAAGSANGQRLLKMAYRAVRNALDGEVAGTPMVNIGNKLRTAYADLKALPVGKGPVGEQFASLTARAEEVASKIEVGIKAEGRKADIAARIGKVKHAASKAQFRQEGLAQEQTMAADEWIGKMAKANERAQRSAALVAKLESELETAGGQISSQQPLGALIEMHGNIQQMAYKELSLTPLEAGILEDLAKGIDQTLRVHLKTHAPQAEILYDKAKDLLKTQKSREISTTLAEALIKKSVGGAVGGTVGFATGGVPGAAAGAVAGVATETALPKAAAWVLEQVMSHPQGAAQWKKAISYIVQGNSLGARLSAERALVVSGARNNLPELIDLLSAPAPLP